MLIGDEAVTGNIVGQLFWSWLMVLQSSKRNWSVSHTSAWT